MATNQPPVTYPPRFFPQGMPLSCKSFGRMYVDNISESIDEKYPDRLVANCRSKRYNNFSWGAGVYLYSLTPKPDGILGFTPAMYDALIAGRKTQITVPIRKKVFKAGDIVRVGERFGYFDFEKNRIIYWSDGTQCDLIDNNIKTYRGDDFPPSWRLNGRCNWHNFPNNLPLWATRHFIRITGVETKAPCEFTEAEILAEGIYKTDWVDYDVDVCPPFWTFDGSWLLDGDEPIIDAWKALWLSVHPKDGETTFEQLHTVYQFELCK